MSDDNAAKAREPGENSIAASAAVRAAIAAIRQLVDEGHLDGVGATQWRFVVMTTADWLVRIVAKTQEFDESLTVPDIVELIINQDHRDKSLVDFVLGDPASRILLPAS